VVAAAVVGLVVAALLGACDGAEQPERPAAASAPTTAAADPGVPPFADCAALAAPPRNSTATAPAGTGQQLPAATLDCFTGGAAVPVTSLRGPAVVNLWATWCPPCRQELPVFQQLAERAGDRVHVVGIDTMDDRTEAIRLAERLGVTFPTLVDPTREILRTYGGLGLPMTLFVDGEGKVQHVYNDKALDGPALGALVEQHLGLAVDLG
jgi:thiol-disulfide isomerase/thioredoxin